MNAGTIAFAVLAGALVCALTNRIAYYKRMLTKSNGIIWALWSMLPEDVRKVAPKVRRLIIAYFHAQGKTVSDMEAWYENNRY